MRIAAIIVAAGRGTRAGGQVPKQYRLLGGVPMLARTISAFTCHPAITETCVVIHRSDGAAYDRAIAGRESQGLLEPVAGGATRQESVIAGLESLLPHPPALVLIHDAARPFVSAAVIDRVIEALKDSPGAVAALPVVDSLKRSDDHGQIVLTVDRAHLWHAQTPQGFRYGDILAAHQAAKAKGLANITDDAAIARLVGLAVQLVPGSERNVKITNEEDLAMVDRALDLEALARLADVRTGNGFDVHRFTSGSHVMLCGVRIPHTHGLEGHSDADAPLHALTDAILGAIGAGDIGMHFPPSEARWKGAPSELFLKGAASLVAAKGGRITHVDVTVLCEAPRIGPHRETMRARMADILGLPLDCTSVKATTTEGLGFTGRGEGLAAIATATVRLPFRVP
jgi:2-C-methyl-D-erythritol 4-phosphate cytidylyltransferase/2-C-methyl-D-erythritol 2,4-cyclodiphosphate synthase